MQTTKWKRKESFGGLRVVWELTVDGHLLRVARNYREGKIMTKFCSLPNIPYYEHNMSGWSTFVRLKDAQADAIKEYQRKEARANV